MRIDGLLKKRLALILTIFFLFIFFAFIYKLYIPRINAFGCFDDCFNFLGGYFILGGKTIYTNFFFNHQPGMAFLSAFIQGATHPTSIAELVLRHRQFIILFSFLASIFFVVRFSPYFVFYTVIYELSKFYVFGDRFLAEGLVGYLLVYLLAVNLETLAKKSIRFDLYVVPIFAWAVIFLREPYVLASLLLFTFYIYLLFKEQRKKVYIPLSIFGTLAVLTLLSFNLPDYYFNVIVANGQIVGSELSPESLVRKILVSLLYPLYLIFSPETWTLYRTLLAPLSIVFFASVSYSAYQYKKYREILLIATTLFLSNLRPVEAFRSFYETFNTAVWSQIFFFSLAFFIFKIYQKSKKTAYISLVFILVFLLFFVTNRSYFAYEKVNTSDEFFTNFSLVMDTGTKIRNLSKKDDTFFVDGLDDLIIWESKLPSPYKYVWYTSFMPNIKRYRDERIRMFEITPPDFYYGQCMKNLNFLNDKVSQLLLRDYVQINPPNDSKCILVNVKKVKEITREQRESLRGTKYTIPNIPDK